MKTLGKNLVKIYILTIFASSIFFGILINIFLDRNSLPTINNMAHHHFDLLSILSAVALLIICLYTIFNQKFSNTSINENTKVNHKTADISMIIKGMTCNHCKETAKEAILSCKNINSVKINLESGQALIYGNNIIEKDIIAAINDCGFSVGKNL